MLNLPSSKLKALFVGCLLLLAIPDVAQSNEQPPAEITLLVFEQGRPQAGIDIEYGEIRAETGSNGLSRFTAVASTGDLILRRNEQALMRMPLGVEAAELLQIIVSLQADGAPQVSLESSLGERDWALPAMSPAASALGETIGETATGQLQVLVVSTEDASPIVNARVFIAGTGSQFRTDEQGRFQATLPVGEYAMSVLHPDYATRTVDDIAIAANADTEQTVELPPSGLELAEFVVVEPYIEGSLSSVVDERRNSAAVTDLLAAEQISRAGDSNAASALRRVTGLTLVDGKFIFVRGLGERYSSTLVNGAPLPSPDPTRKVVPLDLFPTNVVRSIAVQKSYSASKPGEFGGGAVEIRTRGIPDGFFASLSASVGANSETGLDEGLRYAGGTDDWTGWDNGSRGLPESFSAIADQRLCRRTFVRPECLTSDAVEGLGEDFAGIWNIEARNIGPDLGIEGAIGNAWETPWFDVGLSTSASLDHGSSRVEEVRRSFNTNAQGELNVQNDFAIDRTTRTIDLSAFTTGEVAFSDNHRLLLTSLLVRQTEDEARLDLGNNQGLGIDTQTLRGQLEWIENALLSHQLRGEHTFSPLGDLSLNWQFSEAKANRDAPRARSWEYDDLDGTGNFRFAADRAGSNETTYARLDDEMSAFQLDMQLPIQLHEAWSVNLGWGISQVDRDRDSLIRRFVYATGRGFNPDGDTPEDIFTPDNIGNGLELRETTRDTDAYTANQSLDARYLELDTSISDWLRITAGRRWEDNRQEVITTVLFQDTVTEQALLETEDSLPSYALTWMMSDTQQLRLSYGRTVNRPDFRELTSAPFTDPRLDIETRGNPELRPASIEHYDLRWEWYFEADEYVSVALFKKDFTDPIETVVQSGENILLSLQNALAATNQGVEIEGRMTLDGVHRWLSGTYIAGNYAWIDSEIDIDTSVDQQATNANRALQGQSDYIANVQFGYDDEDRGLSTTLVANMVGPRISRVGTVGIPDEVEQAYTGIDLVVKKTLNDNMEIGFKLQNLLDQPVQFQFADNAISREYRRGRDISLSFEVNF
jgi:outer membrane cobalamin receptor